LLAVVVVAMLGAQPLGQLVGVLVVVVQLQKLFLHCRLLIQ
jgi:hypothetical protein